MFVHISAVERAGLSSLNEGATVSYEVVANRGEKSAENLRVLTDHGLRQHLKNGPKSREKKLGPPSSG